ncbi:hypothetical protein M758_UG076900 [Ceratodon purpureus]|nr:hypothetical protein M758_UG076900 [Ceratodon purpureus]
MVSTTQFFSTGLRYWINGQSSTHGGKNSASMRGRIPSGANPRSPVCGRGGHDVERQRSGSSVAIPCRWFTSTKASAVNGKVTVDKTM